MDKKCIISQDVESLKAVLSHSTEAAVGGDNTGPAPLNRRPAQLPPALFALGTLLHMIPSGNTQHHKLVDALKGYCTLEVSEDYKSTGTFPRMDMRVCVGGNHPVLCRAAGVAVRTSIYAVLSHRLGPD